MEPVIGLIIFFGILVLIIGLPIRAAIKSGDALRRAEEAHGRIRDLVAQVHELRQKVHLLEDSPRPPFAPPVEPEIQVPASIPDRDPMPISKKPEVLTVPPPLPTAISPVLPPPIPAPKPIAPPAPVFNIEQFMGAKLFAWIGGLALFLGVVFFVKYAFERNLIPPAVRVAIGFLTGAGLLVAGVLTHRKKAYIVLGQTLCASGTLILYGVTFAARTLYHFPAFGTVTTFLLMCAITTTAFLLAVRLNAVVIAILGIAGGFLTPILVSTGQDNPFGLFSYIAILVVGLLAVARFGGWHYLAALGASGILFMQLGWFARFFHSGNYAQGNATLIPMGIFLGFIALFVIAGWRVHRLKGGAAFYQLGSALALSAAALIFGFVFLKYGSITERPFLLYGYLFLINLAVLAAGVIQPRLAAAQWIVAAATFIHLSAWTDSRLTPDLLPSALVCYFVFGLLHSVFPIVWKRFRPDSFPRSTIAGWIPVLPILLILLSFLQLDQVSFMVWPALLLVNLLLIYLAVSTSALTPLLAAIVLTLVAAAAWLFKMPFTPSSLSPFLGVVGGFSVFFVIAGAWLARRLLPNSARGDDPLTQPQHYLAAAVPISSAALPFLLLILAINRLPMPSPTPVFGLGLLLVVILLSLAKIARLPLLSLATLACALALEMAWHTHHFDPAQALLPLGWYLGFGLLFAVYPFVFQKAFREDVMPWAASALSSVGHFLLIYDLIKQAYPNDLMGLIPAAFTLPALLGLIRLLRTQAEAEARNAQLAWFGGVTLFFITLIFPVQFDRQWLTLGWALEGAALCWLFNRIPHPGLRYVGIGLLTASFIRLTLNPAVLSYQERSTTPILNWHLYTYLIAAASQFMGAWWLKPPHDRWTRPHLRGLLCTWGGILLFVLLNIQIADAFTPAGERFITLDFNVNFGRDMTYSISWALFALALIMIGLWKNQPGARYAGIGLLAVTLVKLFFHDLSTIESIYRIAALIVVAIIALAASFLYQRFFDEEKKT
jgi:hypothetical protein